MPTLTKADVAEVVQKCFAESFKLEFVNALQDEQVLKQLKKVTKDEFLHDQLAAIRAELAQYKTENAQLRTRLAAVEKGLVSAQQDIDQSEQQERKDAVRLFNIPEDYKTRDGKTDDESVAHEIFQTVMGSTSRRKSWTSPLPATASYYFCL